jgi:hypothetical protein
MLTLPQNSKKNGTLAIKKLPKYIEPNKKVINLNYEKYKGKKETLLVKTRGPSLVRSK